MSKNKIGYLLIAISLPMLALAVLVFTVQMVSAAPPSVDLEQCANGGTNQTDYCSNFVGLSGEVGWVTGNSNAQKSTYWIDDYIVYRMIFQDLASNETYCGGFTWDVSHQGQPAIDYIGTFSNTMFKANPLVDTNYDGQRATPYDQLPIPLDPMLKTMPMNGATFTGTQPTGDLIKLWGAEFVASPVSPTLPVLRYGNVGQFTDWALDPQPANQQSLEFCFTVAPTATQAVASWSGHIADPDQWKPLDRPSGSPYHTRYGTQHGFNPPRDSTGQFWGSDGTDRNFGNLEVQLDIAQFDPTAITLRNITAEGQSSGLYLALLAAGVLALLTGSILVWQQRQAVKSTKE